MLQVEPLPDEGRSEDKYALYLWIVGRTEGEAWHHLNIVVPLDLVAAEALENGRDPIGTD